MNTPEKPDYGEPWKKYDENGIQSRDEFWIADVKTPLIRDRIVVCVNACEGLDDPAKEIAELRAKGEQVTHALGVSMMECNELAKSMHRRHYAESAPQWESLSDVPGIISQIDNMHAGVCQQLDAAKFENQVMREAIKAAHGALEKAHFVHKGITTYTQQSSEDYAANTEHCEMMKSALAKLEPYIKP